MCIYIHILNSFVVGQRPDFRSGRGISGHRELQRSAARKRHKSCGRDFASGLYGHRLVDLPFAVRFRIQS